MRHLPGSDCLRQVSTFSINFVVVSRQEARSQDWVRAGQHILAAGRVHIASAAEGSAATDVSDGDEGMRQLCPTPDDAAADFFE